MMFMGPDCIEAIALEKSLLSLPAYLSRQNRKAVARTKDKIPVMHMRYCISTAPPTVILQLPFCGTYHNLLPNKTSYL
jgi:hypothetical protein